MSDVNPRREQQRAAIETVLDLFATATGIPITLYEFPADAASAPVIIISPESRQRFAAYCTRLQQYDGGQKCSLDQMERARKVFESGQPALTCCHAGLYNKVAPILDEDGRSRAVVSYGEARLRDVGDECYVAPARERHASAARGLQLPMAEAKQFGELYDKTKELTYEEFEGLSSALNKTIQLLYTFIDQGEQMQRARDQLNHEMQTPIQDVLGRSELLVMLWPALHMDEALRQRAGLPEVTYEGLKGRILEVFTAANRLRTVAETMSLGANMAAYLFSSEPLLDVLYAAKANYEDEAKARMIEFEFDLRLKGDALIECSRQHLQLALNNLIFNAVKYSYAGGQGRRRFVRVSAQSESDVFVLRITNYGIGILPEEISGGKIFEDEYQGQLRRGESRTGSGKGLYFAKSIIERHHGRIEVQSNPVNAEIAADDEKQTPYVTRVTVALPYTQSREAITHAKDYRVVG